MLGRHVAADKDREVVEPLQKLREHGFARVYFHHIRRTGGTSLNQSFFALYRPHPELVSGALRRSNSKMVVTAGTRFVGANRDALQEGDYFYGFSHIPSYDLVLPADTFTITLLRDPLERVVSHYRMVVDYSARSLDRPWLRLERQWLGRSIADFVNNMPRSRFLAQLHMFSASSSVDEAVQAIAKCDFILFNDDYSSGLSGLNQRLGLNLKLHHSHTAKREIDLEQTDVERIRRMLATEYALLDRVRDIYHRRQHA